MKSNITKRKISYVISVSVGTGCYRHIQISGKKTLDDLAGYILDAFDFDFDHLYSFFMDNKWWSQEDAYNSPYSDEPPYADRIKLSQLQLNKGQAFKFLFDYGDEWRFQCKVLRVLDEDTSDALIIRSVGKAPEQYPCYDEDYDEDFYEDDEESDFNYTSLPEIHISENFNDTISEVDFEMKTGEIPDELLEAAFKYRNNKLWKKLYDSDIFAVKLSDGRIGYCSVMGELGECIALALYIGDEGLYSLDTVMNTYNNTDPFAVMISQNCLQFELTNSYDMPDEIVKSVQKYAKEHNVNLKGKNRYPYFPKFQSYYVPWIITEQTDFQYMLEAIRAANEVFDKLKRNRKINLGFDIEDSRIPLLTPTDNGYHWSIIDFPEIKPVSYPAPQINNDILIGRIRKLEKHGTWEYRHFITSQPVPNEEKQLMVYPSLVLTAIPEERKCWAIENSGFFPDEAEHIINAFATKLLEYGTCPETILTCGQRSVSLLSDFCEKCNIKLLETNTFEMIDDMLDKIMDNNSNPFKDSQFLEILSTLELMSEKELRSMPPQLMTILFEMIGNNVLSPSLEQKIRKIYNS